MQIKSGPGFQLLHSLAVELASRYPTLSKLADQSLAGSLPASMNELSQLKHLDLQMNALTSSIPPAWFTSMAQLQDLLLVGLASLTGGWPHVCTGWHWL